MANKELNDIKFKKTNGGIGRTSASKEQVSGLIFGGFGSSVLTFGTADGNIKGFDPVDSTPSAYIRKFTYAEELEDAGIVWKSKGSGTLTAAEAAKNALYYHISEFFRINSTGTLYVMVKAGATAAAEADVETIQVYAGGEIRQCGIFSSSLITVEDLQEKLAALEEAHMPMSVVETYDGANVTLSTLKGTNASVAAGNCNVSILIGCDGDAELAENLGGYSTTGSDATTGYAGYGCIGACIGAISKASVHESIAWVEKFPLGLNEPAIFNGNLYKNISLSDREALNGNHYLFVITHTGDADNYFNDSHTCDLDSSDYAYIENVRTIDKACCGIRQSLLPQLASPLEVDASTGQLSVDTVSFLETEAGKALEDMEKAGELSGYKVEIDPEQNVLSTGLVEVVIKNVPMGIMRKVNVKIGYTTKL